MIKLELLARDHDRQGFDCGSQPLNHYLRAIARQHAEKGISKTYVLVSDENTSETPIPVLGYFAITMCEVESLVLHEELTRRFPNRVPALRLGRLAVGLNQQGKGIGGALMSKVLGLTVETFRSVGGVGLFVDVKDEKALRFYQRYPFHQLPDQPLKLFMPIGTIDELMTSDE